MALTTVSFSLYNNINIARGLTRMNEDARSYRIRGSTNGKESSVMHTVIMRRKQELGRKTEEVFEVTRAAPLPSTVGDRGQQPHQIRISSNRHTRQGFDWGRQLPACYTGGIDAAPPRRSPASFPRIVR